MAGAVSKVVLKIIEESSWFPNLSGETWLICFVYCCGGVMDIVPFNAHISISSKLLVNFRKLIDMQWFVGGGQMEVRSYAELQLAGKSIPVTEEAWHFFWWREKRKKRNKGMVLKLSLLLFTGIHQQSQRTTSKQLWEDGQWLEVFILTAGQHILLFIVTVIATLRWWLWFIWSRRLQQLQALKG